MVISGLSQPIAFDTGSEEAILRANMEKLNIGPEAIDVLFRFHFMATTRGAGTLSSNVPRSVNINGRGHGPADTPIRPGRAKFSTRARSARPR